MNRPIFVKNLEGNLFNVNCSGDAMRNTHVTSIDLPVFVSQLKDYRSSLSSILFQLCFKPLTDNLDLFLKLFKPYDDRVKCQRASNLFLFCFSSWFVNIWADSESALEYEDGFSFWLVFVVSPYFSKMSKNIWYSLNTKYFQLRFLHFSHAWNIPNHKSLHELLYFLWIKRNQKLSIWFLLLAGNLWKHFIRSYTCTASKFQGFKNLSSQLRCKLKFLFLCFDIMSFAVVSDIKIQLVQSHSCQLLVVHSQNIFENLWTLFVPPHSFRNQHKFRANLLGDKAWHCRFHPELPSLVICCRYHLHGPNSHRLFS